ncbi:MAG: ribulose-phosphate 3-epimerase [Acidobacteriota bacterium]
MAIVAPSLLSADFANLERDIRSVEAAGATVLHFDVMDGRFVPNITMGTPVLRSIRRCTRLKLDVHLMIVEPEKYVEDFVKAGADTLAVHFEAVDHLDRVVDQIHEAGVLAGIAINPATPVSAVGEIAHKIDFVLVMSVNPGFGGQKFIDYSLLKVRRLKDMLSTVGSQATITIDGGIGPDNAQQVVAAGADLLVAGSSVFGNGQPGAAFKQLAALAAASRG